MQGGIGGSSVADFELNQLSCDLAIEIHIKH